FLYYDYLLTIGQEIDFFWGRGITPASGLFFASRYFALLGNIPVILQTYAYWSPNVIQILILITRTYALYQRSRRVLVLTSFTAFCVIAFAAVSDWLGAAWAGVVVFDTEILILTVWKTVQMSKIGGGHF
ncbi:hypothetical protein BD410DRAFT_689966, partial [Rickenella mellea]